MEVPRALPYRLSRLPFILTHLDRNHTVLAVLTALACKTLFLADYFSSTVPAVFPLLGLLRTGLTALAAAQHAHNSAQSAAPPTFEFFTPDLAKEVDAVAARIIPTDQTPGARETGVVYFIDRALATFASGDRKLYTEGIAEMQARASEMFPGLEKFSAATDGQQDEILRSLEKRTSSPARPFRPRPLAQNFFETLRQHTLAGFLIDPDSQPSRNRGGVGQFRVEILPARHTAQKGHAYFSL